MEFETEFTFKAETDSGPRLDRFLAETAPDYSRSLYSRLIKEGLVLVDGWTAKPSARVKHGSEISVKVPVPRLPEIVPENIPLDVIYEDADILVINKQAGLVVHPAYGHERGTLVNALLHRSRSLSGLNGPERPGIVHRLDKDTTGIILAAKNDRAHEALARQFHDREVKKQYLAVTLGVIAGDSGTVDAPIGRSLADRKKMAVRHDTGREAVTDYKVEERFEDFTLVRCFPHTGRTHQVRLHMRVLNHPILCDAVYSRRKALYTSELEGKKRTKDERPIIERQALHAAAIEFTHPSGEKMSFEQPMPEDMTDAVEALRKNK